MENDISQVIKATQLSLGKYVKRPALTEKLLRKPPFRFLHDIITTVLKTTGFFGGLFEENELDSDNVKDRDSKITFLNKVTNVLGIATGRRLSVKPTKIIAGQEPEKTNELLQCLAEALNKNISSDEAVKAFKAGSKPTIVNKTIDNKKISKESIKTVRKSNDQIKLKSSSNDKLVNQKKVNTEKSQIKNEKGKSNAKRSNQTELSTNEQKSEKLTSLQDKIDIEKKENHVSLSDKHAENKSLIKVGSNELIQDATDISEIQKPVDKHFEVEGTSKLPNSEIEKVINSSYTIGENDLNSSLSSQDLMEVENTENKQINIDYKKHFNDSQIHASSNFINVEDQQQFTGHDKLQNIKSDKEKLEVVDPNVEKSEKAIKSVKSSMLRPSSSRPGAPRLRERHESITPTIEKTILGKVNIITENSHNEEEEESNVIIVQHQAEESVNEGQKRLSIEHGQLVQQILDSQKETQISGPGIEWQFGKQIAREAINKDVEQLRFNIQALSRVANPLGKLLDHVQEDVEVMRQELLQWQSIYDDASKELMKQKKTNEESLSPLHTKLKQLDLDILDRREKINDLKVIINRNESRIEKLLYSERVQ